MTVNDFDKFDLLQANAMAIENFVHAALITLLAECDSPQQMAEKIGQRAKWNAETIRRSKDVSAAIVLPMEDRVGDMVRNLIISTTALTGKPTSSRR